MTQLIKNAKVYDGTGADPFMADILLEGDRIAKEVLDEFFGLLAEGITGLVNIFRPGAVIIGGGLAEAGDALFVPVNERVSHMTYASSYIAAPPVLKATGGVYTGAIGAALLQKA